MLGTVELRKLNIYNQDEAQKRYECVHIANAPSVSGMERAVAYSVGFRLLVML